MHQFVNQKRYEDKVFEKKLFLLFMKSAFAGSRDRLEKRKDMLLNISKVFPYYYSALFYNASSMSKFIEDFSSKAMREKVVEEFRQIVNSFMVVKIIVDNLVREKEGEYYFGEVDNNIGLQFHLFHDKILNKPKQQFKSRNFNVLLTSFRKKEIDKDLLLKFSKSLKELSNILDIYIGNYELFKSAARVYESQMAFREINWAVYSLAGFIYRWGGIYQWLGSRELKTLKRILPKE
jgi:hypothetical protein